MSEHRFRVASSWSGGRDSSGSIVLVSHDPEFVRAIAPDRVLLMPEGELQWWDDDHLELVAMA